MDLQIDDIMQLCCEISVHDEIKVAVTRSTTGALVAGGGALVGGLLGGPVGIGVGGALGGLLGGWMTSGKFKPLPQILMELPPKEQQKLYDDVMVVLIDVDCMDATQLITIVMADATLKKKVKNVLINYVRNELSVEVQYQD